MAFQAFELMKRILFQPFDLKKWLMIGFGLFRPPAYCPGCLAPSERPIHFLWIASFATAPRLVEPWRQFRAEGNSFFLFSLVIVLGLIGLAVLGTLGFALPLIIRGSSGPVRAINRILLVPDCPNLSGVDFGCDIAIDGAHHVPATVSCAARIFSSNGFGCLPSRADPSICVICSGVGHCGDGDQLCGCTRDLLHRSDSLCRLGHTLASFSDARCIFAFVSATVRFGLRCLGGLYATGILPLLMRPFVSRE
jgi:hypothetical protein